MLEFQGLRAIFTIIGLAIVTFIAAFVALDGGGFLAGTVAFFFLLVAFLLQGFPNIPSSPLQRGIVTFLGAYIAAERGGVSIGPGRVFLPFYGILFGYVPYDASKRDLQFSISERTPDNGTIRVSPFVIYQIDQDHPVWFIIAGKIERVEEVLVQRIDQALRIWVRSPAEGPLTWQEAMGSNGLAMSVIVDKLVPNKLPEIPPQLIHDVPGSEDIPISLFVKYFTGLPPLSADPVLYPQEVAAHKFLEQLKVRDRQKWNDLRAATQARMTFLTNVKDGLCSFPINNLGIIITGIGIGPIEAEGRTAEAADSVAAEKQKAELSNIKTNNFRDRVKTILLINGNDEKNAVETVQLIDGLITKASKEKQFAVRADTLDRLFTFLEGRIPAKVVNDPQALVKFLDSLLTGPLAATFTEWLKSKAGTP